jgi:hypothetical protein
MQVVLDAQQLQGIPAIAVDKPRLQVPETGDLMQRIPGEYSHRGQRYREAGHQP